MCAGDGLVSILNIHKQERNVAISANAFYTKSGMQQNGVAHGTNWTIRHVSGTVLRSWMDGTSFCTATLNLSGV